MRDGQKKIWSHGERSRDKAEGGDKDVRVLRTIITERGEPEPESGVRVEAFAI